jgi:F-type H+-transporting ATPase subunit alpha
LVKSKNKTKEYKMVKIEPDEISSIIRQQIAQYSEEVKVVTVGTVSSR